MFTNSENVVGDSRWLEVKSMFKATTENTIPALMEIFARISFPKTVSDKVPQFRLEEFEE